MSLKSAPSFPGMKERFLVSYRIQFPFFQAGFTRLKSAPSFPGMKKRVLISYKILVLLGIQERVSWSERVCYSMAWMFDIPRIITYKTDSKLWSVCYCSSILAAYRFINQLWRVLCCSAEHLPEVIAPVYPCLSRQYWVNQVTFDCGTLA